MVILGELQLDPGIESGDVDAGHLRGPAFAADGEAALIEQVKPRFPGGSSAGRQDVHRDTSVMFP